MSVDHSAHGRAFLFGLEPDFFIWARVDHTLNDALRTRRFSNCLPASFHL